MGDTTESRIESALAKISQSSGGEPIVEMLREDGDVADMKNINGWAIGTIQEVEDGEVVTTIEETLIELFNGEGTAGKFTGVRFIGNDDGEYEEAYAYPAEKHVPDGKDAYFVVTEYDYPEDPNYEPAV